MKVFQVSRNFFFHCLMDDSAGFLRGKRNIGTQAKEEDKYD
jgi:hypothetical protein